MKREWIVQAPKVLVFQVNRAQLNAKTRTYQKNNETFSFPERLFLDRYLGRNRQEVLALDLVAQNANAKIKTLENHFHDVRFYGPYKLDLAQVLETFQEFCDNSATYKDPQSLESLLYSEYFEAKGRKEKQRKEVARILKRHREAQERLEALTESKVTAYQSLNKCVYRLQSVTIHYGDLQGGHYYSYVRREEKWFKFNDAVVTPVSQQTVFDDAQGKKLFYANCYCLFYEFERDDGEPRAREGRGP